MWKFGGKFILSTLYALALITFFTNVLQQYEPITHDRLMAAVAGSCLVALGMGVVLRCHATTGGMDIIVKLLRRRYPYIRTGSLFFMLDTFVVMFARTGIQRSGSHGLCGNFHDDHHHCT